MIFIKHKNTWYWGKSTIIVAEPGYGVVTVQFEKGLSEATIVGLSVHELHRNMGYGTALLAEAEKEAKRHKKKSVVLYCDPNSWTAAWYERKGYKKIGTFDSEYTLNKMIKRFE